MVTLNERGTMTEAKALRQLWGKVQYGDNSGDTAVLAQALVTWLGGCIADGSDDLVSQGERLLRFANIPSDANLEGICECLKTAIKSEKYQRQERAFNQQVQGILERANRGH